MAYFVNRDIEKSLMRGFSTMCFNCTNKTCVPNVYAWSTLYLNSMILICYVLTAAFVSHDGEISLLVILWWVVWSLYWYL